MGGGNVRSDGIDGTLKGPADATAPDHRQQQNQRQQQRCQSSRRHETAAIMHLAAPDMIGNGITLGIDLDKAVSPAGGADGQRHHALRRLMPVWHETSRHEPAQKQPGQQHQGCQPTKPAGKGVTQTIHKDSFWHAARSVSIGGMSQFLQCSIRRLHISISLYGHGDGKARAVQTTSQRLRKGFAFRRRQISGKTQALPAAMQFQAAAMACTITHPHQA